MSLLRRIEGQRPAGGQPAAPQAPGTPPPPGGAPPKAPSEGPLSQTAAPARDANRDVRLKLQTRIINNLDPRLDLADAKAVRSSIEEMFNKFIDEEGVVVTRVERQKMLESILDEILGFGPIEPLLKDDTITEVMVNGPFRVYVERKGKLQLSDVTFTNDDHVMRIIERIIAPIGRRVDESKPYEDARLPDGSRVNIIIPPLALNGPVVTIRKFPKYRITVEDYIKFGTATAEMMEFMRACVEARLNMFISGGTGSGKTTLLNIMSGFIPEDERIITIEDAAELRLVQDHVVRLESRAANIEGKGAVTIMDLVKNSLRMRPERIVVGEIRGGEALSMLQAMNTGHDGSLSTGHANSPRDMLSRLETMCLMAGVDLPARAIKEQIASALDVIVQISRLKDGSRKITNITEVQGMEGEAIVMQDVFVFEQTGYVDGKVQGRLRPTGIRPKFSEKFEAAGIKLPQGVFGDMSVGLR
ncbi:MAG TPA: CpaF family protein [Candidatus Limnocylindria bacterium]|jgi:pilus assembly protein CpaF|nr:CpaF family protein [Candidatus Limnocylindria bacterium]